MRASARVPGRILAGAVGLFDLFAAVALMAMMLLTFVNVWQRYFFNRPILGAFEVTELLVAAVVFLALPMTVRGDQHIRMDLTEPLLKRVLGRWYHVAQHLLGTVILAFMAWKLFGHAGELKLYRETTVTLGIGMHWIAYLMSIGLAVGAIVWARLLGGSLTKRGADHG